MLFLLICDTKHNFILIVRSIILSLLLNFKNHKILIMNSFGNEKVKLTNINQMPTLLDVKFKL